jgi:CheY-like chemotaxis protein
LVTPERRAALGSLALLVDASPARRAQVTAFLQAEGYAVLARDTAIDAHSLAQRLAPALIVVDLDLPHRSGLSLLVALKADPRTAGIPVIGLTAWAEQITPARQPLLVALVPKPGSPDALRTALASVQATLCHSE